jgi:hypothetical protein
MTCQPKMLCELPRFISTKWKRGIQLREGWIHKVKRSMAENS